MEPSLFQLIYLQAHPKNRGAMLQLRRLHLESENLEFESQANTSIYVVTKTRTSVITAHCSFHSMFLYFTSLQEMSY